MLQGWPRALPVGWCSAGNGTGAAVSHCWARLCRAGSAEPAWGRASPGAGPALRGEKVPSADGAARPCQAAVLAKPSPPQGGSLNFGAPGCAEQAGEGTLCLRASGIAGGLLTGNVLRDPGNHGGAEGEVFPQC